MPDLVSNSLLAWVTDANLKIIFSSLIILALITVVALGVDFLIRKTIIAALNYKLRQSRYYLLRLLPSYHVFGSLALLIFGLVFVSGSFLLVKNNQPLSLQIANLTLKAANLFNLYILTLSVNRAIFALHDYYQANSERDDKASWHSYIKIVSFFTWILMAILAASYIFEQAPTTIVAGLGAISAIVLLVFRDTFLGIVASIQANATSMVRVGDWISIAKHDIEGTVEDISINTVRIRNGDNTVTTLPTYNLTTEAVKNWEYMRAAEGRRFRQAIWLDPLSIKFISADFIAKLAGRYAFASKALQDALKNETNLTNLGVLRTCLDEYLSQHGELNPEYSSLVRLLPATSSGLPLEITGFTIATSTASHELVKAAVLEFAYAACRDFELSLAGLN